MSPLTFAMSTATHNSAQTSSNLIPGQHYLETNASLSDSNQDHTFMGDYIIPVLKQQTRLLLHLCVDHNGQINLRAKQKCEVLSATVLLSASFYFVSFSIMNQHRLWEQTIHQTYPHKCPVFLSFLKVLKKDKYKQFTC